MKNIFSFIRRYFIFLSFLLLQAFCLIILGSYSKTHEAFLSNASGEITGKLESRYSGMRDYLSLKEANRQLAAQNAALLNQLQSNFQKVDQSVNTMIDSLYKDSLGRSRKYVVMPAKVVGNTVTLQSNYLTLERGAKQGVKKDMAVISPEGIAGVVVSVSDSYSKVMSLLHRNSKVSVMLKKDNIAGSIEWDGVDPAFLLLKNIPKSAVVKTGDTVLTSTYSAKFPSHLMVGRIAAIVPDKSSNFYILKVKTATNFYNIQNAYIIENMRFTEQNTLENMPEKNQ